jgi:serine phosphatase RsbU (regulator of sigma subunit)
MTIRTILLSTIALTAALLTTSCNRAKVAGLKANNADSLMFDAGTTENYARVLELADSFETAGDISPVNANRWRGVAYYHQGNVRAAEFYFKKVTEANIQTEQDRFNYYKAARRLAMLLTKKGDYEGALQVALPTVELMEEKGEGSDVDFAILLNNIGTCQLNLGMISEAASSYRRAFDYYMKRVNEDRGGRGTDEAMMGTNRTASSYLGVKRYEEALTWIERSEEITRHYETMPTAKKEGVDESHGRNALYRAIAYQGLGQRAEAIKAYRNFLETDFGKSPAGRIAANDYLLAAQRYGEAADNYRFLDELLSENGIELTLDNIQQYLSPKFAANVGAKRKDSAIVVGTKLCEVLDSAIQNAKTDDAAQLAIIYDTQHKEEMIRDQQAKLSRQRSVGAIVALLLMVVFMTIYGIYRRNATHRLAAAHAKLQVAYDQLEETTAAKERIESELRIARDIQKSMVPNVFPTDPGIQLYASMMPAKEVGGDFYNYLLTDDRLYFCLGDVSGKGIPASLFMAQATRLFRSLASQHMMPADIANRMNAELSADNEEGMFVTMFIGLVNLKTGRLDFCNAGHNPPVIWNAPKPGETKAARNENNEKATFMEVEANTPIALWPEVGYVGESIDNIKGRAIFIYSDGLTEAEDKDLKQFGEDRLLDILLHTDFDSAMHVVETLKSEIDHHRAGAIPNDDLTMLCLRIS